MKEFGAKLNYWLGGDPPVPDQLTSENLEKWVHKAVAQHEDLSTAAEAVYDTLKQEGFLPEKLGKVRVFFNILLFIIVPVFVIVGVLLAGSNVLSSREPDLGATTPITTPTVDFINVTNIEYLGELNPSINVGESLTLRFQLADKNGHPVDSKQVNFLVSPPDQGRLEIGASALSDTNGQVDVNFIAGNEPGHVEIIAAISDKPDLTATLRLQIVGRPELQVRPDTQNMPQEAEQGDSILVQFLISNKGSVQARDVKLHAILPQGTTFNQSAEACRLLAEREVVCDIGIVQAQGEAKGRFQIQTDHIQTVMFNQGDYWLTVGGNDEQLTGQELLSFEIREPQPTVIRLSTDIARLFTTSEDMLVQPDTTTTITIELLRNDGQIARVNETVILSITDEAGEPVDESLAMLESSEVETENGQKTVNFIAGVVPNLVTVVAATSTGLTSEPLVIEIVKPGQLNRQTHLHNAANLNENNITIFQLPFGTPVELLGETENGMEKVAIMIWLSQEYVGDDNMISGLVRGSEEIYIGGNISDPLNQNSGQRLIQPRVNGTLVEVIDRNDDNGSVQVRLIGWVNQNHIAINE